MSIGALFVFIAYKNPGGTGIALLNMILCITLAIIFWTKGNVSPIIQKERVNNTADRLFNNKLETKSIFISIEILNEEIRKNNLREFDKSNILRKKLKMKNTSEETNKLSTEVIAAFIGVAVSILFIWANINPDFYQMCSTFVNNLEVKIHSFL